MERANPNGSPTLETIPRSELSASKIPPVVQGPFQASSPPAETQTSYQQKSRISGPQTTQGTIVFALPVSSQALQQNAGSLAAGIGGIVALFAFLFLPYITVTSGLFGQSVNATTLGSSQGLIWLEALLAVGAVVIAALLVFRHNPFGLMTTPVTTQIQRGTYALIAIGALGILGQLLLALNLSNYNYEGSSIMSMGAGYSVGFWLYLLAMIAVTVGGIFALVRIMAASMATRQR